MKKNKPKASKQGKMWSGRFSSGLDPDMEALSYSVHFDQLLYKDDIKGSLAHAKALNAAGVLSAAEVKKISKGLKQIESQLDKGEDLFLPEDEDIHMAVERILTEKIGPLGKKLHTGRSRNDQVATDFRLYLRRKAVEIQNSIRVLQNALCAKAEENLKTMLPGYTHMQQGQPIYLSHYLLAFFWALERDYQRFSNFLENSSKCPLGSGALAGSGFSYDRKIPAKELGFKKPTENSIDATAHRDFVLEFLSHTSILGNLLSRYAEDFVNWSSSEFGFIELSDAFSTGSSMMPQKKNPDSMELIRGKAGRLLGNFTAVFTAAKGAPLCYSRDLQEDKEPVFDSVFTIGTCLAVMAKSVSTMTIFGENMKKRLDPAVLATDVADLLVENKVPFREAHHLVGALVKDAESQKCSILELAEASWKKLPGGINIRKKLSFEYSAGRRNIAGGTGLSSIKAQLKKAKSLLT